MKALHKVSLFAIAVGIALPAFAQQARPEIAQNSGIADIVVTATRRSENVQDVPVSVSAISADALQKKGVFESSDLNNSMPNLQVSSPYGDQQPNFSVRGIGVGTEFNANAASPVGVYVDEVYQAFRASHGQQLYDLQQVEVVRGPQGTLYGRNTTGGAINFITKAPSLKGTEGYATVGYGTYNRVHAEGAVEFTPIEDKLGIRIAGTYVNENPWLHNLLPAGRSTATAGGASGLNFNSGISPGGTESYGGRITIRFRPSSDIDLSLKGYFARNKGGAAAPEPTGQSKTSDVIDYTNPNFLLGGLFAALAPAGLVPSSYSQSGNGLSLNQLQLDTLGIARTQSNGVVFNAKITLSDRLKLISITGYDGGIYEQSSTDCDGTPFSLCAIGYGSTFHSFNQDVRFDYHSARFKMIFGGYYGADAITADNTPNFFNFLSDVGAAVGLPKSYFNPGGAFDGNAMPAGSLPTGITATQHFKQLRYSAAVYGEGSFEITPTLKLTAGLRYTHDKDEFRDGVTTFYDYAGTARMISVSSYQAGGAYSPYFLKNIYSPSGALAIPASTGGYSPLSRNGSSGRLSGRAILDWKPTEGVMTYASYSRGYRAGTFNGLAYGSANQVYFVKPETVDAFEVGLKSRFLNNRAQINISGFYDIYKGQQGQVVDATATANLVSLDGKLYGLEVEAIFKPFENLTLNAGLGLLHSAYNSGNCPASFAASLYPKQQGNCVDSSAGPASVGGNPFPYAAKSSIDLGADWVPVQTAHGRLTVHGDANYTGHFYYDSFANYSTGTLPTVSSGAFSQGGGKYWLLNGRITYTLDRYSVSIWGKNLTNKVYYPFGIALENLFGEGYRIRAEPRTLGIEASMHF